MSTFIVLCPSHRDHRELALLDAARGHSSIFHDYASAELEQLGRPPQPRSRQGKYGVAVSHVLRRFQDAQVLKVPSRRDLEELQQWQPDIRAEIFATEEGRLSRELQDGQSYRYGILNIGGRDRQEAEEIIAACRRRAALRICVSGTGRPR